MIEVWKDICANMHIMLMIYSYYYINDTAGINFSLTENVEINNKILNQ